MNILLMTAEKNVRNRNSLLMSILFLYLFWGLLYLISHLEKMSFQVLFLPIILYLFSHIFRSLRIWLLMNARGFGLRDVILFQFLSASFGNLTLPFAKDLGLIVLTSGFDKRYFLKTIVVMIYIRFFDLIILLPLMFMQAIMGSSNISRASSTLFLMGAVFIWFGIMLLPKIISIFLSYLVGKKHSQVSYLWVIAINKLKNTFQEIGIDCVEKVFLMFALTALGWITELYAIMILAEKGMEQAYSIVLDNVISTFGVQYNHVYQPIYYVFVFISICLLVIFLSRKLNRNEHNLYY